MQFKYPLVFFIALIGVMLLLMWFFWAFRQMPKVLAEISQSLLRQWKGQFSNFFELRLFILGVAGLAFIIALSGPFNGFDEVEVVESDAVLWILLDTSQSMAVEDHFKNERLLAAKQKIISMIDQSPAVKASLVIFSDIAVVFCPVTPDHEALKSYVNDVDRDLLSARGTNFAQALKLLRRKLMPNQGDEQMQLQKAVVAIFSDGEGEEGSFEEAQGLARELGKNSIPIYTFGVGSDEGGPVPTDQGSFKKQNGKLVISRRSRAQLQKLSELSGGVYQDLTPSDSDIGAILGTLNKSEGSNKGLGKKLIPRELYQGFLFLGILLIIIERLILLIANNFLAKTLVKKDLAKTHWTLVSYMKIIMIWVLGFLSSPAFMQVDYEKAMKASEQGDFEESAAQLRGLLEKHGNDPELTYNAGVTHFRAGDFENAKKYFEAAAENAGVQSDTKFKSLYNLGNTEVARGQLEAAARAYEQSLGLQGSNLKAQENLNWVKEQLKRQQEVDKDESQESKTQDRKDDQSSSQTQNSAQAQKNTEAKQDAQSSGNNQPQQPSDKSKNDTPQNPSSTPSPGQVHDTSPERSQEKPSPSSGGTKDDAGEQTESLSNQGQSSKQNDEAGNNRVLRQVQESKGARIRARLKNLEKEKQKANELEDTVAEPTQDW